MSYRALYWLLVGLRCRHGDGHAARARHPVLLRLVLAGLACPGFCFGSAHVTRRQVARLAPAGKIEALRLAHRRVADAQGHFKHDSPGERARLLKGKRA